MPAYSGWLIYLIGVPGILFLAYAPMSKWLPKA